MAPEWCGIMERRNWSSPTAPWVHMAAKLAMNWGTIVGTRMAHRFPDSTGLHINMPFAYPSDPNTKDAQAFAAAVLPWLCGR
jgi:hypothetical protein